MRVIHVNALTKLKLDISVITLHKHSLCTPLHIQMCNTSHQLMNKSRNVFLSMPIIEDHINCISVVYTLMYNTRHVCVAVLVIYMCVYIICEIISHRQLKYAPLSEPLRPVLMSFLPNK